LLEEILNFVKALAGADFIKSFLDHNANIQAVGQFHKRIDYAFKAFNVEGFWPYP